MDQSDKNLLDRFGRQELGPEDFDHRGHLRLAWLHLRRYDEEEAIDRVCKGIRELATNLGVAGKFNHTLTEAFMRIMAKRMRNSATGDFEVFLAGNADLVQDARSVLAQYFSDERLAGPAAHAAWLEPDRAPIA